MKIFFTIALLLTLSVQADQDIPEVLVDLHVQSYQNKYLALSYKNAPKWHTYWKNPGDAGIPFQNSFYLNGEKVDLKELPWPAPKRFIEGGEIQAYGYEGSYTLFYELSQDFLRKAQGRPFLIHSKWLVCKHICLPGEKKVQGSFFKNEFEATKAGPQKNLTPLLEQHFKSLPTVIESAPKNFKTYLSLSQDGLTLHYQWNNFSQAAQNAPRLSNFLTPYRKDPLSFTKEKLYYDNENLYGVIPIEWDGEFQDPPIPLPKAGKLKGPLNIKFLLQAKSFDRPLIFTQTFSQIDSPNEATVNQFYQNLSPVNEIKKPLEKSETSFWLYLVFAFLGGLILNFMPCVLPVISLKLFGLIDHKKYGRKELVRHNLAYTLGVIFSMLVLALFVVGLQAAGHTIGWGFHLQNPYFLSIMIVILIVFALNLFGVFEFRIPLSGKLSNIKIHDTFLGDFLGGVLAVILSTPCSAPFLGTALTFAFTTSLFNIFIMFTFIGLGLSSPFIATAFIPQILRILPRPGSWMIYFKKFLGVTLILTALWLGDVLWTVLDQDRKIVKTDLPWQPWSVAKMQEMKDQKKLVFIDFTAKWCFTCKVNEKLVLNTDGFKELVEKYDIQLLLADWTSYDEKIGTWLKSQGVVGIPIYFVQKPDGRLINLGETITLSEIEKNL